MTQQFTRRKFLQSACITLSALTVSASGLDKALAAVTGVGPMATCDILIIGSGGAGLRAAVAAMKKNPKLSVVVVSKCMPSRNATCMAEGGINGVTDFSKGDSYELHCYDTVKGGDYLVDQDSTLKFCEQAGPTILELDYLGMPFSRTEDGRVKARPFGGASKVRCNYSADKTGHIVAHVCLDEALTHGVKFLMDYELLDLGVDNGRCEGAVLRNIRTGEIAPVRAKAVVLATGGYTASSGTARPPRILPLATAWRRPCAQACLLRIQKWSSFTPLAWCTAACLSPRRRVERAATCSTTRASAS